jgi:hypothetical protein
LRQEDKIIIFVLGILPLFLYNKCLGKPKSTYLPTESSKYSSYLEHS